VISYPPFDGDIGDEGYDGVLVVSGCRRTAKQEATTNEGGGTLQISGCRRGMWLRRRDAISGGIWLRAQATVHMDSEVPRLVFAGYCVLSNAEIRWKLPPR